MHGSFLKLVAAASCVIHVNGGYWDYCSAAIINGGHWNFPLMHAVEGGYIKLTKYLMSDGLLFPAANVNASDSLGLTPLHLAVSKNENGDMVRALLDGDADVNAQDNSGNAITHYLFADGRVDEVIPELFTSLAGNLDAADREGRTALHFAANKNFPQVTAALLANGANPDATDVQGQTPLHYACKEEHLDIIRTLVKGGARQRENKAGFKPLHEAALMNHTENAKAMMSAGASSNLRDRFGWTPLHVAAAADNAEIIEILAKYGVDVNRKTKREGAEAQTALCLAVDGAAIAAVKALIKHGAGKDVTCSKNGWTASQSAEMMHNVELMMAIDPEADVDEMMKQMGKQKQAQQQARQKQPQMPSATHTFTKEDPARRERKRQLQDLLTTLEHEDAMSLMQKINNAKNPEQQNEVGKMVDTWMESQSKKGLFDPDGKNSVKSEAWLAYEREQVLPPSAAAQPREERCLSVSWDTPWPSERIGSW